MNKDLQKKRSMLENCIRIQTDCMEAGYMHGMLNGLILAHSIYTDSSPVYAKPPKKSKKTIRYKIRKKNVK